MPGASVPMHSTFDIIIWHHRLWYHRCAVFFLLICLQKKQNTHHQYKDSNPVLHSQSLSIWPMHHKPTEMTIGKHCQYIYDFWAGQALVCAASPDALNIVFHRVYYSIWYHVMISYHDIIAVDVISYMISHMIGMYLDSLPGPLPCEDGLQSRISKPKLRWFCFHQCVHFFLHCCDIMLWYYILHMIS